MALADRIQIQQVILNLLQNAVDATKVSTTGRAEVRIRASRFKPGFLLVEVEDEGTGISAADLQRLFDPFFTTKPNGLGIGLSISRSIIESHGGRLWAETNVNGGATFRFTLPALPEKAR
jgi:two-component system, LuxR family, sensor kinase FixL